MDTIIKSELLKCNICKSFVTQPVVYDCGHLFCCCCVVVDGSWLQYCPQCDDVELSEDQVKNQDSPSHPRPLPLRRNGEALLDRLAMLLLSVEEQEERLAVKRTRQDNPCPIPRQRQRTECSSDSGRSSESGDSDSRSPSSRSSRSGQNIQISENNQLCPPTPNTDVDPYDSADSTWSPLFDYQLYYESSDEEPEYANNPPENRDGDENSK